jgi:hypothetical protein
MCVTTREGSPLTLYNILRSNWKKKVYTKLCTGGARRETACLKTTVWRGKGVSRNTENGHVPYEGKKKAKTTY